MTQLTGSQEYITLVGETKELGEILDKAAANELQEVKELGCIRRLEQGGRKPDDFRPIAFAQTEQPIQGVWPKQQTGLG